ncbi:ADYC domain-containing protein [Stigmatella sp. ncwal1]|uniref:ADYC domain-containing protein n=1 Tax=Stigmatella ashevillensis TaxID=2995309 RepID=A0ABT5DCS9_9BACT|nr:ADYC domain-containing protein [Stigmatella ashevillena]MDC0711428.1 ADYC domain-containing protein [Stigmatella ashevillena]
MSRGFCRAVLFTVVLIIGCKPRLQDFPGRSEQKVAPGQPREWLCPDADAARKDHLPQGALFRGECVERIVRVERDMARSGHYVGYTEQDKTIPLKITDTGIRHELKGGRTVNLYTVKTRDGLRDFCPTETYTPTDEETARNCPQGRASCTYFENLKGKAMLIPGYWQNTTWNPSETAFTVSCISGAVAKCIQGGYLPGAFHGEDAGKPLEKLFRACMHAVRADYLKDDRSFTCRDTKIDMYDRWNIQKKEVPEYAFESLWDEKGLVCLRRTRYSGCSGLRLAPDCDDPSLGVGQDWSGKVGLLGVASSSANSLGGKCPNEFDACP